MKIGILEAGLLNENLKSEFDPYPVMFAGLLDRAGVALEYQAFSVVQNQFPQSVTDCDGWLITGSRHGVYEHLDWMLRLEAFIREIYQARMPLVGICFGHQIVASALGGEVVKSDKGWGVGLATYTTEQKPSWMQPATESIDIYAFHQDQVVRLPKDAEILLSSDFCPIAGFLCGDSVLCIQAHPEFEADYELALLNLYSGNVVPQQIAEEALRHMRESGKTADTQVLAEWITGFFTASSQRG